MSAPLVSVITPALNAASTIADCVRGVCAQTARVQHLLLDGASSDNTVDRARRTAADAARTGAAALIVRSEPDSGLYDAMNKGIALAEGEFIAIHNADDVYASPRALEAGVARLAETGADLSYGDLCCVERCDTSRVVRTWRAGVGTRRAFYWGWMPPHPTVLARRGVYERIGDYRLDQGSAADYEWLVRAVVRHGATLAYVPETLVYMRTGGVSARSLRGRIEANRMDRRAWRVNGLRPYPWTTLLKPLRKLHQFAMRAGSGR